MNCAIILAAGSSERFGQEKLFQNLWGKPVIFWSLEVFQNHPDITEIILVVSKENAAEMKKISRSFPKVIRVVLGGKERFMSVMNGFSAKKWQEKDIILIHNAANPGVTAAEISAVIQAAKKHGAGGIGHENTATLRQIEKKS